MLNLRGALPSVPKTFHITRGLHFPKQTSRTTTPRHLLSYSLPPHLKQVEQARSISFSPVEKIIESFNELRLNHAKEKLWRRFASLNSTYGCNLQRNEFDHEVNHILRNAPISGALAALSSINKMPDGQLYYLFFRLNDTSPAKLLAGHLQRSCYYPYGCGGGGP